MNSSSRASFTLSDPFATQPVPAQIIMFERNVFSTVTPFNSLNDPISSDRLNRIYSIRGLVPHYQGVLLDRLAALHMLCEDFAHLVLGERYVFHGRLPGQFDGGHGLLAAEACAAGGRDRHVLHIGLRPFFHHGVHDGPGAGRDAAGAHMDRDLDPEPALAESLMVLLLDLF